MWGWVRHTHPHIYPLPPWLAPFFSKVIDKHWVSSQEGQSLFML
jgi:hypothetical protein